MKDILGRTEAYTVQSSDTVQYLKRMISKRQGVSAKSIVMRVGKDELSAFDYIHESVLEEGTTIHLLVSD